MHIIVRWAVQSLKCDNSDSPHAFLFLRIFPEGTGKAKQLIIMKRFLILVCVTLLCGVVSAQAQSQTSEIVYLKDGSVLKGKVVEMLPDQIKVQTSDGSLFVYPMNEVERVEKEKRNSYRLKTSSANQYDLLGWRGVVELGYIMGDFSAPEFSFSIGYQFNPYLFLGAGTGVQYLTDASRAAIPIFADLRGSFFLGTISPFMSLKMGYEALINVPAAKGGFYCSPTWGVKIMTTTRQAVNIGIGLTAFKPKNWVSDKGFTIKLGYEF